MTFSWLFKIVLLIFLVSFTIFLKIKDFHNFIDPEAFLVTADAFRFARYAIEIQNGTYGKIDYLANVPDYGINQYPPPLISLISAWLSNISGIQIHYFFLLLPPFLSVLVVIPLYLWLKPLDNDYVTFGAITMTLFNFFYFVRTRAGYFDTDCMILFFIFSILFFLYKGVSLVEDKLKSYLYIMLAALTSLMFKWWYEHLFFTIILLASLLLGLIAYRHSVKDVLHKTLFFLLFFNPAEVFFYILDSPFLKDYIYGVVFGISSYKMPIDVYASISELIPFGPGMTIFLTTDNKTSFWVAVIFGFVLYVKNWRFFLPSIPILSIALMSFYAGNRYLMYLGPFIGMGFGFGIYLMISFIKKYFSETNQKILHFVGLLFVIVLLIPSSIINFKTRPLYIDEMALNIKKIKDITEPHAYIWSWWGMGNIIQYYSNRAVYVDNTHFEPLKLYIILKSFTTKDEVFMYRAISFLTRHTERDYKRYVKDTNTLIDKIKSYEKCPEVPVYVFLYNNMMGREVLKNNNLSKDEAEGILKTLPIDNSICKIRDGGIIDCKDVLMNIATDNVEILDEKMNLEFKKIIYLNKKDNKKKEFRLNDKSYKIVYIIFSKSDSAHKIVADREFDDSLYFKMLFQSREEFKHFELIYEDFPYMVLYKVRCKD